VNTKLNHTDDWLSLARQSNWSVARIAEKCDVSVRTLERYFNKTLAKSPKMWLSEQRQIEAIKLLRKGSSVKETASQLGYNHPHHFSRAFKYRWGFFPTADSLHQIDRE